MNATAAAQRVSVVAADGIALQTRRIGRKVADTTVILLHGLLGDRESWRCQTSHLASRHPDIRVIAYDLRGHGRSGRGRVRGNTLEQLAGDLDAVIDTTTPTGDIVLVGHSMGAMTVLQYLQQRQSRNTDRIIGVGLIATAAAGVTRHGLGRLLATAPVGGACALAAGIPGSVEALRINAVRATEPIWRPVANRAPTVGALISSPELAIVAGFLDSISHFDGTAAYPALRRIPTLIMCGIMDRVTPPNHSAAIAAAVPAAELFVVPGAGHMLMLERPEVVNDRLDALLERAHSELAPRLPVPVARAG